MSLFDDLPAAEPEPPRPHHPWEPPEAAFPGLVSIDTLQLGRTEQVAVGITGMSAYAAGFEIFVTARIRSDGDPGDRMPETPPGLAAARRSFRFGLQLSDGGKVLGQLGGRRPDQESEPAGPILRSFMGGGGPRSFFSRWWAWPLPPAGPMEFVCEWPTYGIAETRAGSSTRRAAAFRSGQKTAADGLPAAPSAVTAGRHLPRAPPGWPRRFRLPPSRARTPTRTGT